MPAKKPKAEPSPDTPPPPITATEAGQRLRDAFDAAGWTQSKAAKQTGIPQPRWSEWFAGKHVPDWPRFLWIVKVLGLDPRVVAPELCPKKIPKKSRKGG